MKRTLLLLLFSYAAWGQTNTTPIKTVERIFNDFIKYEDHVDSEENKEQLKRAFTLLKDNCSVKDLEFLCNVWMYYDATDFPTRSLLEPIFLKNKKASLNAIDNRIKHKRSWEKSADTFNELLAFKKQLMQ